MLVNINLLNTIHTQNTSCCIDAIPLFEIGIDKPSIHRTTLVMEQQEIWVDIIGYESYYQISNRGNVRSKDRCSLHKSRWGNDCKPVFYKGKCLKKSLRTGYWSITFVVKGIARKESVHRLLAIHFIPNPFNKSEVNHINGIKTDNRLENLEWNTRWENDNHARRIGLTKPTVAGIYHPSYGKEQNNKAIYQIDPHNDQVIEEFSSIKKAASAVNRSSTAIWKSLRLNRLSAGYKWKYK